MLKLSCHCGNLRLEVDAETPETLTSCNCSICRRYGHLMFYLHPSKVKIIAEPDSIEKYAWGDKELAFVHCKTCGCMSHWESLTPEHTERMGINARLFEDIDISNIRVRHFDGADTWKYLD